jgi:hypothetical protein
MVGRPKGSPNKKTAARENALRAVNAIGKTPLDVMIAIMGKRGIPVELQLEAAAKAAPYCHPRLLAAQFIDRTGERAGAPRLSDAELARALLLVIARGKDEMAETIEGVVRHE